MSEHIVTVSDDNFEDEVLNSSEPVLVDYWAEWCGPCKAIGPVLEELAPEYAGKVKIAKLDVDKNPATATRFGIRSIPTLMLFKNGSVESSRLGALSRTQLKEFLDTEA